MLWWLHWILQQLSAKTITTPHLTVSLIPTWNLTFKSSLTGVQGCLLCHRNLSLYILLCAVLNNMTYYKVKYNYCREKYNVSELAYLMFYTLTVLLLELLTTK